MYKNIQINFFLFIIKAPKIVIKGLFMPDVLIHLNMTNLNIFQEQTIFDIQMDQPSQEDNYQQTDNTQKQIFLREQILDKKYEPEQFIQYLNEKLHIDSNLSKCTMEELQQIVKLFKKEKAQNEQNSKIYDNSYETMICDKITIVENNAPKIIQIKENPKILEQQFIMDIKCVKSDPQFVKNSIVCQVNSPERIFEGGVMGLGETSYLSFKVWVTGLIQGYVVRRYGDFIWLRNILLKFYPSQIIPPIPNKKAKKRHPRQITKRMRILSMFLNDLVKNPKFLNNKYVMSFLKEKIGKYFEIQIISKSKLIQGQNVKTFETMLSTETLQGTVRVQFSKNTFQYKNFIASAIPNVEAIYKDITRKSKNMRKLTGQKINTLYDMSNKFADLHDLFSKFNKNYETEGISKLSKIYVVLNNMMVEWGNSLRREMEEIQKNLSTFFKYIRQQFEGFKELLRKEHQVEEDFIKQKQLLDRQKEKIYQFHDPNKWMVPKSQIKYIPKSAVYDKREAFKIMLPKESVRVNQLKLQMGYYLGRIYQNGNTYFIEDADKFCQNFSEFVIKTKVNNQQIGAMWAQMSAKFTDPYKKNQELKKSQNILQSMDLSQYAESSYFQ